MDIYTASTLQVHSGFMLIALHGWIDDRLSVARWLKVENALQVQWHGVLGNHDYGELWLTNETSIPQPTNCPNTHRDAECSYGPLAQVGSYTAF